MLGKRKKCCSGPRSIMGETQLKTTFEDIIPSSDNTYDLGSSDSAFKDLYLDGHATVASLEVPTTGGTAASLVYYEEYDHTTTYSGIWAAPVSGIHTWLTRTNEMVNLSICSNAAAYATTATFVTMDTVIPARFRPQNDVTMMIVVRDNGGSYNLGSIYIDKASGLVKIYRTTTLSNVRGNFSGSGGALLGMGSYFSMVESV